MGKIYIGSETPQNPISLIGKMAGICWGADVYNDEKNYKRGLSCLEANHGRTFEFVDVFLTLDEYSARVIREWYTHIGGAPTRLQASTRYIDYEKGFDYVIPPSIQKSAGATAVYENLMQAIQTGLATLKEMDIPKEDCAMALPLGMKTKIVCKHNLRNLIDMSRQRMCNRAYWEYRELFKDLCEALSMYSAEWKYIVDNYFYSKCEKMKQCPEEHSCGKYPKI